MMESLSATRVMFNKLDNTFIMLHKNVSGLFGDDLFGASFQTEVVMGFLQISSHTCSLEALSYKFEPHYDVHRLSTGARYPTV